MTDHEKRMLEIDALVMREGVIPVAGYRQGDRVLCVECFEEAYPSGPDAMTIEFFDKPGVRSLGPCVACGCHFTETP